MIRKGFGGVGAVLGAARTLLVACLGLCLAGCASRVGDPVARRGDEIMVCGQLYHTGAPVVLWSDPGGYDAYRTERRFVPLEKASWEATAPEGKLKSPERFNLRKAGLSPEEIDRVRGGGWDLPTLQKTVDQFVLHYDVCGTSRTCFRVLQDMRGLSVHFMLDIDGTIYQTLDVKERAWHATTSNDRSVGVEIANIGAYSVKEKDPFERWYVRGEDGTIRITVPPELDGGGVRTAGFVGRPARNELIVGEIQGTELRQYDFTPQQYESLARLTATLCSVLPQIRCDYPRNERGELSREQLPKEQLDSYKGVMGHYHIQANKTDPGPALQWDRVIGEARKLMPR